MKTQMIIKIDNDLYSDDLSDAASAAIKQAAIEWPVKMIVSTKSYYNKKLLLVLSNVDSTTLQDWLDNGFPSYDENGDPTTLALGFNAEIMAIEGQTVDQAALLNYFEDEPITDENGDITGYQAVTDLTGKIQTYAGHKWTY
jgi:hypothetical protein